MISVTNLKGTSRVSSDRITINDNFQIIVDAINSIKNIVDTTTGKIDISTLIDGTLTTKAITVTNNNIDVIQGDINVSNGLLSLGSENLLRFGQSVGTSEIKHVKEPNISSGNVDTIDFTTFNVLKLPRLTTVQISDIDVSNFSGGELVFDTDTNTMKYYNNTNWV